MLPELLLSLGSDLDSLKVDFMRLEVGKGHICIELVRKRPGSHGLRSELPVVFGHFDLQVENEV